MKDWQSEIVRDGVTAKQKRAILETLANVKVAKWATIAEGLNSRGIKRFKNKNIRRFLHESPDIVTTKDRYGSNEYRLTR